MSIDTAVGFFVIVAFLALFYGPWQNALTDLARNYIFEGRDAIFDMAVRGRLEFSSTQYITLRSQLQALIRFAHEATLPSMVWIYFSSGSTKREPEENIYNVIDAIPDKETAKEIRRRIQKCISAYMAIIGLKSLLFIVPFIIYAPVYMCFRGVRRSAAPFKLRAIQIVQWEASRVG